MPQPPHSIQPVPLQVRQRGRSPRQTKQRRSISALGSVNGKNDGRSRVAHALAEHRRGEVVERALEVGHRQALVDREPLDLVEDRGVRGVQLVGAEDLARADDVDRQRRARAAPRACTGEVCVRSTRPLSGGSTKNVSCICRAGWSGSKFSASKLNHSASTSGPSATSQPIADEDVGDPLGEGLERVPGAARRRGRPAA